jgi:hypothetical protein
MSDYFYDNRSDLNIIVTIAIGFVSLLVGVEKIFERKKRTRLNLSNTIIEPMMIARKVRQTKL